MRVRVCMHICSHTYTYTCTRTTHAHTHAQDEGGNPTWYDNTSLYVCTHISTHTHTHTHMYFSIPDVVRQHIAHARRGLASQHVDAVDALARLAAARRLRRHWVRRLHRHWVHLCVFHVHVYVCGMHMCVCVCVIGTGTGSANRRALICTHACMHQSSNDNPAGTTRSGTRCATSRARTWACAT